MKNSKSVDFAGGGVKHVLSGRPLCNLDHYYSVVKAFFVVGPFFLMSFIERKNGHKMHTPR